MSTKPERRDDAAMKASRQDKETTVDNEDVEDVEGHLLSLTHPVAWEVTKARQQEIARESTRHSLIAEAKAKARRHG